jgi:hypothetical protein
VLSFGLARFAQTNLSSRPVQICQPAPKFFQEIQDHPPSSLNTDSSPPERVWRFLCFRDVQPRPEAGTYNTRPIARINIASLPFSEV